MTPEEKAKRYDELAKEVKDFFEGKQKMYSDITQTLEYLFPELKEDDDEKIRKALICGMYALKEQHKTCFASIPIDNVIAWLEKQGDKDGLIKELGEYKAKYTQEVLEKHLRVMNKDDERLRKTTISFLKDFADKGYENAVECIDWLEKQSEQKSQGKTALEAINEEKVDNSNRVEPKDYNSIDPHFGKPTDKVEPKFKVKYAGNEYNVLEVKDIYGIEFYGIEDEPNHIDYVQAENCERVDGYSIKESGSPFPTKPAKFSEQNSAWSEEDESMLFNVINRIEQLDHYWNKPTDEKLIDWLKSLKERVQPYNKCKKKSLATADLENSLCNIQDGFSDTSYEYRILGEAIEFIRCTEPKPQWKPSDEQIKHLTYVVYDAKHKNRISTNGYEPYSYLYALLMQLKKLKG